MSSDKDFSKERTSSGPNNLSIPSLLIKIANLEKRQEDLEKLVKGQGTLDLGQKLYENDSTANTNQDELEILKFETRHSRKHDQESLSNIKSSINELSSVVDTKHSDISKKLEDYVFKQNTKYCQVTERMNLFQSNVTQELEQFKNELMRKMGEMEKPVVIEGPQTPRSQGAINEVKKQITQLESTFNESLKEVAASNRRNSSTTEKALNNISHLKQAIEDKLEDITGQMVIQDSKFQAVLKRMAELENDQSKRPSSKYEKILDHKVQEMSKSFNSKYAELSNTFMKKNELDSIFEGQTFTNGIGEIVSQLEALNKEINKSIVKINDHDKYFININSEMKKIKESHNLLVDNFEKRFVLIDNKFDEAGLKTIKSQMKQYEDFIKRKEIYEKQTKEERMSVKERRESDKELNPEIRLKQVEDSIKLLDKTIKSLQNLNDLNQNSFNLKYNEIEIKLQNESLKLGKAIKDLQERYDIDSIEVKKKMESVTNKMNETEMYLDTFNKIQEENKLFEIKLLEDYKNIYERQKDFDQHSQSSLETNEIPMLSSLKYRSKSTTNVNDNQLNIKNIILIIESHSMQRYSQIKKQIQQLSSEQIKLKDCLMEQFSSKFGFLDTISLSINSQFKNFEKKLVHVESMLLTISAEMSANKLQYTKCSAQTSKTSFWLKKSLDQKKKQLEEKISESNNKLKEVEYKGDNLSKELQTHLSSIWDTIALVTK